MSDPEVMESLLLLHVDQFFALEEVAFRMRLTVGQLIRRTIDDFLLPNRPDRTRNGGEISNLT